jgi:hypothetical protein
MRRDGGAACSRWKSESGAAGSLEKVCRRAALRAGAIESYSGAWLRLETLGGMADESGRDQRCNVEREVAVADRRDHRREGGAVLWNGGEVDSSRRRELHRAVMCAVPSAASRQNCVGVGGEGEQRRDQRKAEEEKQGDAEKASHSFIVRELRQGCCQRVVICTVIEAKGNDA